jgi:hypothetical protein
MPGPARPRPAPPPADEKRLYTYPFSTAGEGIERGREGREGETKNPIGKIVEKVTSDPPQPP